VPALVVGRHGVEVRVELVDVGAEPDVAPVLIEVHDVHVVHLGQMALVEADVDALALTRRQRLRRRVVLQGGDVLGEVAERRALALFLEIPDDVAATAVLQDLEYQVEGQLFGFGGCCRLRLPLSFSALSESTSYSWLRCGAVFCALIL